MTVFVCEDSLDGILTGVYDAWDSRLGHSGVRLKTADTDTYELFCEYREVAADMEKAEKVLRTVLRRMARKPGRRSAMPAPAPIQIRQTPSTG